MLKRATLNIETIASVYGTFVISSFYIQIKQIGKGFSILLGKQISAWKRGARKMTPLPHS